MCGAWHNKCFARIIININKLDHIQVEQFLHTPYKVDGDIWREMGCERGNCYLRTTRRYYHSRGHLRKKKPGKVQAKPMKNVRNLLLRQAVEQGYRYCEVNVDKSSTRKSPCLRLLRFFFSNEGDAKSVLGHL
jgi:hypothetical protein